MPFPGRAALHAFLHAFLCTLLRGTAPIQIFLRRRPTPLALLCPLPGHASVRARPLLWRPLL